nr:hypothetical protein CFP56_10740 [Quercus suber]
MFLSFCALFNNNAVALENQWLVYNLVALPSDQQQRLWTADTTSKCTRRENILKQTSMGSPARQGLGLFYGTQVGSLLQRLVRASFLLPSMVEEVEALATRQALLLAPRMGLQGVIFEGDNDTVIKEINSIDQCMALHGYITKDIKMEARKLLDCVAK